MSISPVSLNLDRDPRNSTPGGSPTFDEVNGHEKSR